jgi:hypothetical protein
MLGRNQVKVVLNISDMIIEKQELTRQVRAIDKQLKLAKEAGGLDALYDTHGFSVGEWDVIIAAETELHRKLQDVSVQAHTRKYFVYQPKSRRPLGGCADRLCN